MGLSSCLPFLRRCQSHVDHESDIADTDSVLSSSSTLTSKSYIKEKSMNCTTSSATGSPQQPLSTPTTTQVQALRALLAKDSIDWFVIFSDDQHASEYTAPPDQRRSFMSGFTGSVGIAIVGRTTAHQFADGRYWVQATQQLDQNWTLHKVGATGVLPWDQWLLSQVNSGEKVGLNPKYVSYGPGQAFVTALKNKGAKVYLASEDLVDAVWTNKPAAITEVVRKHPLKFSGKPAEEKLMDLAHWLRTFVQTRAQDANDATYALDGATYLVTALDEVAWILNLRGEHYVPNTPVFPAYVAVTLANPQASEPKKPQVTVFIDAAFVPFENEVYQYFTKIIGAQVRAYEDVWTFLPQSKDRQHVLVSGDKISLAAVTAWGAGEHNVALLGVDNPVALAKALKNPTEIEGYKHAYLRDGVAWAIWAAHLEADICKGLQIDEWQAAERLDKERQKMQCYAGLSYAPISATGPNAALPHYQPSPTSSKIIDRSTPYLADCGSQYLDGTIDTTRTVFFGGRSSSVLGTKYRPTPEQKRGYTRALQGHIGLDTAVFPADTTTGSTLDVLARRALWQDGMNFATGTGHGVGSYLGVHEGPQGFSTSSGGASVPATFQPGMVITNEPGYYEEGSFGVRIESLLLIVPTDTRRNFGGNWLKFERITVVPIDTSMVEWKLLTPDERQWLHDHNEWCKRKLTPLVKHDPVALRWLMRQ